MWFIGPMFKSGNFRMDKLFYFHRVYYQDNENSCNITKTLNINNALLTAEDIWFKCDLYLWFVPSITNWNICIDLRPFLKCKEGPFLRSWRSPRSDNLEIQNYENFKWKLIETRWNPKFGLRDLKNDLLNSTTSEVAEWIFSKNYIF